MSATTIISDDAVEVIPRAGFTYRFYRLKPRASRSKGASSKLWYA